MTSEGFLHQPHRDMLLVEQEIGTLLDRFAAYSPPDYTWRENPIEPTD